MRVRAPLQAVNQTSLLADRGMDAVSTIATPRAPRLPRILVTPSAIVLGLAALSLAVRIVGLGQRPLWLDEAYSAWFSSRSWHYLWTVVPTYEPHPPFYYSLLKVWRSMFGGQPIALRMLSVLFGVLTIPVIAACAGEMEKRDPTGRPLLRLGLAAFLAGFSPMLMLLGQEARPYPFMILSYGIATLGLLRLMREFAHDGPGKWSSWFLIGVGSELSLWAHGLGLLYALFVGLALAPAWLKAPLGRPRLIRGIVTAFVVLLFYLPCLMMIVGRAGDWGSGWLRWDPIFLLELLGLYGVPVEALTIGSAVAALAMLLLVKRAVQEGLSHRPWTEQRALLLLWWGPPLTAALVSALFVPVFLPRTLAATLVPAYLSMSGALARSPSARERLVLAAAIIVPLVPTAFEVALRPPTEQWNDVNSYLASHVARDDLVWLYPNDSALPLRAAGPTASYTIRGIPGDYPATSFSGPIRAGSPAVRSLTHEQAQQIASDKSLRGVPTIWLVTRQHGLFDPQDELPKALERVRRAGELRKWGYIEVRPYYSY